MQLVVREKKEKERNEWGKKRETIGEGGKRREEQRRGISLIGEEGRNGGKGE